MKVSRVQQSDNEHLAAGALILREYGGEGAVAVQGARAITRKKACYAAGIEAANVKSVAGRMCPCPACSTPEWDPKVREKADHGARRRREDTLGRTDD
jgi:hypothetical protein